MKTLIYGIIAAAATIEAAGNRILKPLGLTHDVQHPERAQ